MLYMAYSVKVKKRVPHEKNMHPITYTPNNNSMLIFKKRDECAQYSLEKFFKMIWNDEIVEIYLLILFCG